MSYTNLKIRENSKANKTTAIINILELYGTNVNNKDTNICQLQINIPESHGINANNKNTNIYYSQKIELSSIL